MKTALYDLSTHPTTFDFAPWLVLAKSAGCTHVRFAINNGIDTRKYSKTTAWKRFGNILVPMCALAGMDFSIGDEGEGVTFPYAWGDVERVFVKNGIIELLDPTYAAKQQNYVTITLRNSFRNKHRDSNLQAWKKFEHYLNSRNINVIVLEDCEKAPMDLEYRMALYHGANMNFGASGGPMSLCAMSVAPYMIFNIYPKHQATENTYDVRRLMEQTGFGEGSQFSFKNDRQLLVWEYDDYENIVKAYEQMEQQKEAA